MKKLHFLTIILAITGLLFPPASAQLPLTANLGNDTTLCKGSTLILDAGIENTTNIEFYWNDEPAPSTRSRIVTEGGEYWVRVKDNISSLETSDTIIVTGVDVPDFDLEVPFTELGYNCKGDQVEINVSKTSPGWVYIWEGVDASLTTAVVDTTGEYSLKVIDENNCESQKSVQLEFQYPYEEDRLILVTWDPLIDRNIMIWRSTIGKRTRGYIITRGEDEVEELGEFLYTQVNLAEDNQWDPKAGPAVYNCMVVDSCDNLSSFSNIWAHTTLHLTVERLDEPAGASKLSWNPYRGFDYEYFYISRGTEPDRLEIIDSVLYDGQQTYDYIDNTLISEEYFYQVLVNTPEIIFLEGEQGGKKASPGPFVHSLSNLEDNRKGTSISNFHLAYDNLKVFPNPYSGTTNIRYTLHEPGKVRLEAVNLLGQRIILLQDGIQQPGTYQFPFSVKEYGFPAGMYYIRYEFNNQGVVTRKLIER